MLAKAKQSCVTCLNSWKIIISKTSETRWNSFKVKYNMFTTTINPFKRLAAAHKTSPADRRQLTSAAAHQATADISKTQRRQLTSPAAHQATADVCKHREQLISAAAHQAKADVCKHREQLISAAAHQATADISKQRDDSGHQLQHTRRRLTSVKHRDDSWHQRQHTRRRLTSAKHRDDSWHQQQHTRRRLTSAKHTDDSWHQINTAHQTTADISGSAPVQNARYPQHTRHKPQQSSNQTSAHISSSPTHIYWHEHPLTRQQQQSSRTPGISWQQQQSSRTPGISWQESSTPDISWPDEEHTRRQLASATAHQTSTHIIISSIHQFTIPAAKQK
jgi:hypothetical protein